jgi:hypothetical protein
MSLPMSTGLSPSDPKHQQRAYFSIFSSFSLFHSRNSFSSLSSFSLFGIHSLSSPSPLTIHLNFSCILFLLLHLFFLLSLVHTIGFFTRSSFPFLTIQTPLPYFPCPLFPLFVLLLFLFFLFDVLILIIVRLHAFE